MGCGIYVCAQKIVEGAVRFRELIRFKFRQAVGQSGQRIDIVRSFARMVNGKL